MTAFVSQGGELVSFSVPGLPVPKGRPRLTTRGGIARAYTPEKTRSYESAIRVAAVEAMDGRDASEAAVSITVTAYLPMPKRLSKADRELAIDGVIMPTTRPDADNYAKAALDACNAILFKDDSQVTDLIVRKRYAATPRLLITMEVL